MSRNTARPPAGRRTGLTWDSGSSASEHFFKPSPLQWHSFLQEPETTIDAGTHLTKNHDRSQTATVVAEGICFALLPEIKTRSRTGAALPDVRVTDREAAGTGRSRDTLQTPRPSRKLPVPLDSPSVLDCQGALHAESRPPRLRSVHPAAHSRAEHGALSPQNPAPRRSLSKPRQPASHKEMSCSS